MSKIRVLMVDDSALIRQILSTIFSSDPEIEVIGTAQDPYVARDKIKALDPDVLTLDVEMPRMDGLTFLEKLMEARPMPVVMVSSLTEVGCDTTMRALELGAVDFFTKPQFDMKQGIDEQAQELILKIKVAALARIPQRWIPRANGGPPRPLDASASLFLPEPFSKRHSTFFLNVVSNPESDSDEHQTLVPIPPGFSLPLLQIRQP